MLPFRARVDLGVTAINLWYFWSLTIRLFVSHARNSLVGVLALCVDAVSVFYSPSLLGKTLFNSIRSIDMTLSGVINKCYCLSSCRIQHKKVIIIKKFEFNSVCPKLCTILVRARNHLIELLRSIATTPSQRKSGSDGNKGVLHIPLSSRITGASLSDCLVPYLGHTFEESYASAEMLTVYSAAQADWTIKPWSYPMWLIVSR